MNKMPALTHVYYWSKENGWVHINADALAKIHPYSISADSKMFICRLCNQYVSFCCGDYYAPYFKHTSCRESDSCPDKTESYSSYTRLWSINYNSFPIRIIIQSNKHFSFELGVTLPLFQHYNSKQFTIITDSDKFIYDTNRITQFGVSYFGVGDMPSNKYRISFEDPKDNCIPTDYNGFTIPCLFDGNSRKKLPENADVLPNHEYYLLTFGTVYNCRSVDIKLICSNMLLSLYSVRATEITKESVDFFVNYGAFLTERPIDLTPVWPIHYLTPYVIKHNSDNVWFYIDGSHSFFRTFPNNLMESDYSSKVVRLRCSQRQQLVAVGHTQILKYTYLINENNNRKKPTPVVTISDINEDVLNENVYNKLPPKRIISIKAPFDGSVKIEENGRIINIIPLSADTHIDINNVSFEQTISIFQGLDIIKQVSFERASNDKFSDDELLSKLMTMKGKKVKVPHRFGNVILKLGDYPKTCDWLKECLSEKEMYEQSYLLIKCLLRRN